METQQVIDNLISMKTEIEFESDDTKKMKRIKIDTINEAIKALKKQMEDQVFAIWEQAMLTAWLSITAT